MVSTSVFPLTRSASEFVSLTDFLMAVSALAEVSARWHNTALPARTLIPSFSRPEYFL